MLSKKMTVSLMSLITILALGFIVSPALAANEITLSLFDRDTTTEGEQGDYSAADGIQVIASTTSIIKLASKEALGQVALTDITVVNTGGTQLSLGTLSRVNTKEYTFQVESGLATGNSVTLIIDANKLASVDTGVKDHKAASLTIHYMTADTAFTPYASVARSDETTPLIVEDTVVFTVTLSEEPKGGSAKFTKDSITVTEATVGAVDFIGAADEAVYNADGNPDGSTGPDVKVYRYSVTVMPKFEKTDPIKFTVKQFEDQFGKKSANPAVDKAEFKVAPSKVAAKPKSGGN